MGGLIAITVLTRLLAQGDQEKRLALGFSGLRLVAMALIPVGALMILSSGVRMISAGQVGVAVLFGKVQPVVLHEGINLVNPLYDVVDDGRAGAEALGQVRRGVARTSRPSTSRWS